jgi:hypothetical protein
MAFRLLVTCAKRNSAALDLKTGKVKQAVSVVVEGW